MKTALPCLLLSITACTAPVLAPSAELAGTQPVGTAGTPIETLNVSPPFPAWTTATPLTLVAPGGANLGVIDRVGVRVQVLQIRAGRVHVRCSGCEGTAKNAEGYLPRQVLWSAAPSPQTTPSKGDDPLSLLQAYRARWSSGLDLPEGGAPSGMCWLADQGVTVDGGLAQVENGGGIIQIQRSGAHWKLTHARMPTTAPTDWRCDAG